MEILLQNKHLAGTIELLDSMYLAAQKSRARTKLLQLVRVMGVHLSESEYELLKEYATLTPDGAPAIDVNSNATLKDPSKSEEYNQLRESLLDEYAQISGPTFDNHEAVMLDALLSYEDRLSGAQAEAYDALCDALEKALTKNKPPVEEEEVPPLEEEPPKEN